MALQLTALTSPHPGDPFAFLLEVSGFRILLDCGCDSSFSSESTAALREAVVMGVHAVLLSQPDLTHVGALPLLSGMGYRGPVYCTGPVAQLGEVAVRSAALARAAAGHALPFPPDAIRAAFAAVTPLKYQQPRALGGGAPGVEVEAYNSGVNLGGSLWRLRVNGEDLLYAPRFSLRAERHLDPALALHRAPSGADGTGVGGVGAQAKKVAGTSLFSRPLALLTSAPSIQPRPLDPRTQLAPAVLSTLAQGGNVLVPVASVGRLLELALALGEQWRRERVQFGLALLAPYGERILGLARAQLEYAGAAFRDAFQASLATRSRRANQGAVNPFLFPDLRVVSDAEGIADLPRGPKVVLALAHSLEEGPARDVLLAWAEDAGNLLLFVEHQREGTLARQLQDRAPDAPPAILQADVLERVLLEGRELEEHRRAREGGASGSGREEAKPEIGSPGRGGFSSMPSSPGQGAGAEGSSPRARRRAETRPPATPSDPWRPHVLIDGFEAPSGLAGPMFPLPPPRPVVDEFGVQLLPGDLTGYFAEEAYDLGTQGAGLDLGLGDDAERAGAAADPLCALLDPEQPFRVDRVARQVFFSMRVATLDLTGSAYDLDLRFAIEAVAPRAVVLLRGEWGNPLEAARARVQGVAQHPDVRARVEALEAATGPLTIPLGPPSFTVRLGPDVLERCQPTPRGDCSLGAVKGHVRAGGGGAGARLTVGRGKRKRAGEAALAEGGDGSELFIGDSSSRNVQAVLRNAGLPLDFKGSGVLFSAASNLLITAGAGDALPHLIIEGTLSQEFYRAKQALEGLLKIQLE